LSYSFDAANDHLEGVFSSSYGDPITLACWIKISAHPGAINALINLGNSTSTVTDSYFMRIGSGANVYQALCRNSAADDGFAQATKDIGGVWTPLVAVYSSPTLRDMYVADQSGTNGTSISVTDGCTHVQLGESLANTQDFLGLMAEVAIWNSALSAPEIASYIAGTAASQIAAANLVGYWPLSADNATQANEGIDAGADLSVTGAVFDADHPTITIPTAPSLYVVRSGIRFN
jgi:hypothetical protein